MATEDLSTKILDVRPSLVLDKQVGFVPGFSIDYNVGSHGPYTLQLPAKGYTALAMKAAVEAQAAEIRQSFS